MLTTFYRRCVCERFASAFGVAASGAAAFADVAGSFGVQRAGAAGNQDDGKRRRAAAGLQVRWRFMLAAPARTGVHRHHGSPTPAADGMRRGSLLVYLYLLAAAYAELAAFASRYRALRIAAFCCTAARYRPGVWRHGAAAAHWRAAVATRCLSRALYRYPPQRQLSHYTHLHRTPACARFFHTAHTRTPRTYLPA